MKTKVVFLQCMILSIVVFGQNNLQKSLPEIAVIPPKFQTVETIREGKKIESIDEYLRKNVEYPENALSYSNQGTEVVQFVVTPEGELTDMKVINSVCPEIDEVVIQALEYTSGKWKPGLVNGEPAAMTKEVSLVFKLHETTDFVSMVSGYLQQANKKFFIDKEAKKALKYYDKGIALLPNEESLLYARGLCKYELGDKEGAVRDWNRIMALRNSGNNGPETDYLAIDLSKFKGYNEMIQLTQKP